MGVRGSGRGEGGGGGIFLHTLQMTAMFAIFFSEGS